MRHRSRGLPDLMLCIRCAMLMTAMGFAASVLPADNMVSIPCRTGGRDQRAAEDHHDGVQGGAPDLLLHCGRGRGQVLADQEADQGSPGAVIVRVLSC